jgi:hypothetical protein
MFERGRGLRDPWLVLILIFAALLRFQYVTQPLVDWFSWREASTAMMADNLPSNGWNPLWPQVSWTGDDAGYQGREFQILTIFAALLDSIVGWRDWHGRLIAALCGMWSILALYQVVFRLYGVVEARAAAFVFAILAGAVIIDTSYLPDPAMLALVLTSFWLLLIGLEDNNRVFLFFACVVGTVGILAKLPALATLPAASYLVLIVQHQLPSYRRLLAFGSIVCIAAVPVIAYYRWAIYLGRTYPPYHVAGSGWIWEEARTFWNSMFFLHEFRNHALAWLWTWPVLVLFVIGMLWRPYNVNETEDKSGSMPDGIIAPLFFHFWLAGCAVLYFVAAKELTDNPWNFHIFNPAVGALSGRGLILAGSLGRKALTSLGRIRIGALGFLLIYAGHSGEKQGKVSVAVEDYLLGQRLAEITSAHDLVIVSGSESGNPLAIYYSRRRGWIFPPPPQQADYMYYMDDGAPSIRVFEELRGRGARWFGIVKVAHDFSTPPRSFLQHHRLLLEHAAMVSELITDTSSYIIYRISAP